MERKFQALCDLGRLSYPMESLESLGMSNQIAESLARWGMPNFDQQQSPLGLLFHEARPLMATDGDYIAIGREIWSEGLHVAIKADKGAIWAVTEGGKKPTYMNASIESLLTFMDRVLLFNQNTERLEPQLPPTILTAEQARIRLEQFRRGEIKPRPRPDASQAQREWKADFGQLKRELKAIDPVAVRSISWWGIMLEEMEDRLR